MRLLAVALVLALAGCTSDEPPGTVSIPSPVGTSWATCPPSSSLPLAFPLRSEVSSEPREPGIHRLDARTFLWIWRNYTDDLHEDRLTRVNPVELARDGAGALHLCTTADLDTPTIVDAEPRTYAVGLRITAGADLPPGPVHVTVNWVAACPCTPLPRGNDTALFER